MIVVSDTTPVISLIKAEKLNLLQSLYQSVLIPKAVYDELTGNKEFEDEAAAVRECPFLNVCEVSNDMAVHILRDVTGLDAGESEAFVLYEEQKADLLLMDENKGRKIARKMEVRHIGTVGILLQAADENLISAEEVEICLDKMISSGIRLSRRLCNNALAYVGRKEKY